MLIKKKSLIVAFVSAVVISIVMVINLIGYMLYLEMKDDESERRYRSDLQKVNAKLYAKYIEIARLGASFESAGALNGRPVLEGIIRNDGYRDIKDIAVKVRFLDRDGAVIYDVSFRPQEPSLGSYDDIAQVSIPHLAVHPLSVIRPETSLPFKKVLTGCPTDILEDMKAGSGTSGNRGGWSGRFDYEILSVTF